MKTKEVKYQVWLNSENMHRDSRKWLSELEFVKDEQLFFDDLIKSYTLQLIDSKHFAKSNEIVNELSVLQKNTDTLIKNVMKHEKDLEIMVDGINEVQKENAYKDLHTKLIITINNFFNKYRIFKTQLFSLIKDIIKEGKQKRLLA